MGKPIFRKITDMGIVGLLLVVLHASPAWAQSGFPIRIQDFSETYEARIERNAKDTVIMTAYDELVPPYVIRIVRKSDQSEVLEAFAADFPTYLLDEHNEAIPNVHELPYGEQSVLIYRDVNFDGKEDLALMNGYYSCYGGPSFDIYLAVDSGFAHSEAFSALSNEYCGLFEVDDEEKLIHAMVKSGCCWHQFSEFKVDGNRPVLTQTVTYDMMGYFQRYTTTLWDDGGEAVSEETELYWPGDGGYDVVSTFELASSGKWVLVFVIDDQLFYALALPDDQLEFVFPFSDYEYSEGADSAIHFQYSEQGNELIFSNEEAQYAVYDTGVDLGVRVSTGGRTYDLKGDRSTLQGSLREVTAMALRNVAVADQP